MNSNLDPDSPTLAGDSWEPGHSSTPPHPQPTNWREAILALVMSRIGLWRLEARAAATNAQQKIIKLAVAAAVAFFGWILLLSGAVAAIAHAGGWPWHWIALSFAVIHLLIALLLLISASRPSPPRFQATRAELKKDIEWIENLIKSKKSKG